MHRKPIASCASCRSMTCLFTLIGDTLWNDFEKSACVCGNENLVDGGDLLYIKQYILVMLLLVHLILQSS